MKANLEWIGPDLKSALQTIRYPVHHLDFETFMPSVPQYPMTHPYHTLPFQWSNHIEMEDGTVRHDHYLCVEQRDPREELAVTLLASLGHEGSICVYSGYEWRILTDLAEAFPKLRRELSAAASRLWDLLIALLALWGGFSLFGGNTFGRVIGYIWAILVIIQSFLILGAAPWFGFSALLLATLVLVALSATSGWRETA